MPLTKMPCVKMPFSKMHGIGNDYVYVDLSQCPIDNPAEVARAVSDRHTGIGSDGLILIDHPSRGVDAHARMRMFNADGSEAQMCGNGIRCVTKFVVDRGISSENPLRVETGRGVLEMQWWLGEDGFVSEVEVDMGAPILDIASMSVRWPGVLGGARIIGAPWTVAMWSDALGAQGITRGVDWVTSAGVESVATVVSMGNPHIVFWCRDAAAVPIDSVGVAVERHAYFPQRINVHFVQAISRRELLMRTWERGSGVTLACGTGASAVCVAGVLEDRCDRAVAVNLPGGKLSLRWDEFDGRVRMRGSATHVFDGEWDLHTTRAIDATR